MLGVRHRPQQTGSLDRGVAPLTLLAVELAASSLFLMLTTLVLRVRLTLSRAMVKLAVLGTLNPGLSYALGLLGLVSITASMAVLLWATAFCFAVVLAGTASAVGAAELGLPADLVTCALAAASGMVYYGFAFWFFVGGLRGVPASIAGSFLPLIPVFGLAVAYLLGDRFIDRQWVGAALVILVAAAAAIRHLARPSEDSGKSQNPRTSQKT